MELHFVVGRGTAPRVEAFGLLNRVLIQKQRISKIRGELGEPIAPLFRVFNPSHELYSQHIYPSVDPLFCRERATDCHDLLYPDVALASGLLAL